MLETFNLSSFGALHTLVGLVAVACGIVALARHGQIGTRASRSGLAYVVLTALTAASGLFIFRHGGFGPPHVLSILTLVVLLVAWLAETRGRSEGIARYVAVLGYSLTLFFHLVPGLTETGTRLPLGRPAFSGPEDPTLVALVSVGFLAYLLGAAVQVVRLRKARRLPGHPAG